MELFEEKLMKNAIRYSWAVLSVFIVMTLSGIGLCYLGARDSASSFSFFGLNLSSGNVGLFIIAMAIAMIYSQKRFFEMLIDPQKILTVGSHISDAKQKLSESQKAIDITQQAALIIENKDKKQRVQNSTPVQTARPKQQVIRNVVLMRAILQGVISITIIGFSIFVLSDPRSGINLTKVAIGLLGVVVGYWIR